MKPTTLKRKHLKRLNSWAFMRYKRVIELNILCKGNIILLCLKDWATVLKTYWHNLHHEITIISSSFKGVAQVLTTLYNCALSSKLGFIDTNVLGTFGACSGLCCSTVCRTCMLLGFLALDSSLKMTSFTMVPRLSLCALSSSLWSRWRSSTG